MMVRLDFGGRARPAARALRVSAHRAPGVAIVAECGPRLPFKDASIDELFVDRAIARRTDIADTLDEIWRVSKPGALIHLRLPHASSTLAVTRHPRAQPMLTLDTFSFYDPRFKPLDAGTAAAFTIERARLHLAGPRGDDTGLALARGPFAQFIEKLANGSRGSQYRFERWFAHLFGGFEEFSVVLAVVKPVARKHPTQLARELSRLANGGGAPRPPATEEPAGAVDPTTLRATSDIAHEAANVEPAPPAITVDLLPSADTATPGQPSRPSRYDTDPAGS